ncbi:MAG: hypothetical protein EBU93_05320 [Chlamydiae bacterium]|nr:hypothetical protein [Chlamydiota bacterium]
MLETYTDLLPLDFNTNSRVWIYQSERAFTETETNQINETLVEFTTQWTSHGAKIKGFGKVFFNQFIVLMADETASQVSGCSTDSSVRVIKKIEEDFHVSLFNRQLLAFMLDDKIQLIPLDEAKNAYETNTIHADTLYFNNTILHKKEFEENWVIPLKNSWLQKRFI